MSCARCSQVPDFIPYGRQWVSEADIEAVAEVLRSDYLTTGPAVPQFEHALGELTGSRYAVAVSSGTSALHTMYAAAGIGPGDEILTSPLTFAATANAALYLGASVKFVDVLDDTGNIDPAATETAVTPLTKAIVAVDYAGQPADYDELRDIADRHRILLLADAAHSLGAAYKGRPVGTLTHASAVSFHPVKPVTTGEGGAILTDDARIAERAAQFRTHGITRDPAVLALGEGAWYYEQLDLGYNYRLTDMQAALGWSQLQRLADFITRRREIAAFYQEALANLHLLRLPTVRAGVEPGWHLFAIRVRDPALRRPLFDRLRRAGLGIQVHYIPVYWHPYYQALGYERGTCPIAERFYAAEISLPIFPRMTDEDAREVVDRVREATQAAEAQA